jgi:biopolymer transport protein ExbD
MRIQRRTLKKARIEIIPMIDTIFFLLVFFMISTLSMAQYRGMPVNLPKAASGQQAPAESAAITIDSQGRLFVDKQPVEKSILGDLLRQQLAENADLLVVINADDGVEHGRVVEVMDIARNANVARMAIAVKPKQESNDD